MFNPVQSARMPPIRVISFMMFVVMKTDKKSAEKKTRTSMTNRMNAEKMMPIPKVEARINDVIPEKIVLICKKVLFPCNVLCSGPRIGIDPKHNNEMATINPSFNPLEENLVMMLDKMFSKLINCPMIPPKVRKMINII
jgi:hypothetical protein